MNKTIIVLAVFFCIGVALSIFVFPGISILDEIHNIPTHLQNVTTWISQQSFQVLASIAGAFTSLALVIGKLWSSVSTAKKQAEEAKEVAYTTQAYATQQVEGLNKTIDAQKATITTQKTQIESLEQQLKSESQQEIVKLQDENEKLRQDYNVMERTYQAMIQDLKQKQVTVVK